MSEGEFPGSIWMPHQQRWTGRGGYTVRYIIIHSTATPGIATAQGVGRLFQSRIGTNQGGTHYIVGKDGTVVQGCREEDSAWGNGILSAGHDPWWSASKPNPNQISISIEHVKTTDDNSESLTPAQMEASFRLVNYLCAKWGVPPRLADASGGIAAHASIDPINRRYCPGPYPWTELVNSLTKTGVQPVVPASYDPLTQQGTQTAGEGEGLATAPAVASNALPSAGQQAHAWLAEFPGFTGIVLAADSAEAFQPLQASSIGDVFGWVGDNAMVLALRLVLIGVGLALLLGLVVALVRGNDWIGTAGGDSVPFLIGQA